MEKVNVLKGCKAAAFAVEIIVDQNERLHITVRNMSGQPIRCLSSADELTTLVKDSVQEMTANENPSCN